MKKTGLTLIVLLMTFNLSARTIKVAALAPEGTTWANKLKEMALEVKAKTKGKVKFKIYYGGVAGDEPDVLRKIRVGQMHGGVFTGRTLGDVFSDVRIMEVPFSFNGNREKASNVLKKLSSYFNQGFNKNGFVNLGFFEIGDIFLLSTKKISTLDSLKGIKVWAWEGDEVAANLVKQLNLVSVPLALPDVLASLSTGIIDAAYNSPLGALALQWSSKIKYVVDFPIAFSIGAFLVSNKSWRKVSTENQKIVKSITQKYMRETSDATVEENTESLTAMKAMGIEFLKFPDSDIKKSNETNKKIMNTLEKEKILSKKVVSKFKKAI